MHTQSVVRFVAALGFVLVPHAANAMCIIYGLNPDKALPTMEVGQDFTFVATGDCVELQFLVPGTTLTKKPKGPVGNTYKVTLTEREWNELADGRDELTWSVIGTSSSTGEKLDPMTKTNPIDHGVHVTMGLSAATAKLTGEHPHARAGASVTGTSGHGDGYGYAGGLLVGSPGYRGGRGAAYVVRGPVTGSLDLSEADAKLVGLEGDEAGTSVAWVGDVNDDGDEDMLIGAPGSEDDPVTAGGAYLVLGPVTGTIALAHNADVRFDGEAMGDLAGYAVASAGDVNGDDVDDLFVGAYSHSMDDTIRAGAVYLMHGPASSGDLSEADAKLAGPERDSGAGVSLSRGGDVNGDGVRELMVGADWNDEFGAMAGNSFLVMDPDLTGTVDLSEAAVTIVGEDDTDAASAIADARDVSGDGYDDLLVGAWDNMDGGIDAGAGYLLLGSSTPMNSRTLISDATARFVGESHGDEAGGRVSSAGDVNGDEKDDLLIGAAGNNDHAGAAYLVFGPIEGAVDFPSLSRTDFKFVGEAAHDKAGTTVATAGDVDADGLDDLLVGAIHNSDGAGAVYLLSGSAL